MSYLVLARKHRPQTFTDVIGHKSVVKTLQNSLAHNRVAHAILFSGVRGVGKTTLARIMAKAINCEGETATKPCNQCRSCNEITQGQSLDLREIDGASNRGIQEIRELKEKIRFLPTSSACKIIIIDEVHMLTVEAFNALLKTLEEPPEHVYFMFATTELHKIPITILSRCQRYELTRISYAELTDHYALICRRENVTVEPAALAVIVQEAQGSVRDGLSLLDQMLCFGGTTITHDHIIQVLGLTDRTLLMTISKALLNEEPASALKGLRAAFDHGVDLTRFTADLLDIFRTLVLIKVGDCDELINLPEEEKNQLFEITKNFTFETLHLKLNLLMEATEKIRQAPQPKLALEAAFLKIIKVGSIVPVSELLAKITRLTDSCSTQLTEATVEPSSSKELASDTTLKAPPLLQTQPSPLKAPQKEKPPPPSEEFIPGIFTHKQPSQEHHEDVWVAAPETTTVESDIAIHSHTRDVRKHWIEFTEYVKERKIWMAQDLQLANSVKEVGEALHLHYDDQATCTLLMRQENRKLLTEFVLDYFQKNLTVRFILPKTNDNDTVDDNAPESPHIQRQKLARDPLTQMAAEVFNGQIGDIRIGPRSR